jgi:hypothetical protein
LGLNVRLIGKSIRGKSGADRKPIVGQMVGQLGAIWWPNKGPIEMPIEGRLGVVWGPIRGRSGAQSEVDQVCLEGPLRAHFGPTGGLLGPIKDQSGGNWVAGRGLIRGLIGSRSGSN